MSKKEIVDWLNQYDDSVAIGIDDGGLALQPQDHRDEYLEIGGLPEIHMISRGKLLYTMTTIIHNMDNGDLALAARNLIRGHFQYKSADEAFEFWETDEYSGAFDNDALQAPESEKPESAAADITGLLQTVAAVASEYQSHADQAELIYMRHKDTAGGCSGIWLRVAQFAEELDRRMRDKWDNGEREFIEDVEEFTQTFMDLVVDSREFPTVEWVAEYRRAHRGTHYRCTQLDSATSLFTADKRYPVIRRDASVDLILDDLGHRRALVREQTPRFVLHNLDPGSKIKYAHFERMVDDDTYD